MKTSEIVVPLNVLDNARALAAELGEGASDALWSMLELKRWALAGLRPDLPPGSQGWLDPKSGPKLLAELWEWAGNPDELVSALVAANVIRVDDVAGWRVAGLERYDAAWAKTFSERRRKQNWRAVMEGKAARQADEADVMVSPHRVVASTIRERKEDIHMAKKTKKKAAAAAKTSKPKAVKKAAPKKAKA